MRDPYSVLGVKRDAGADEIKSAWRNIAKTVHPDHNREDPNATKKFAEVGQAYDILKDPKKRGRYDERVKAAEAKQQAQTIQQQRQAAREAAEKARVAKANAEKVMEELARAEAAKAKAQKPAAGATSAPSGNAGASAGATGPAAGGAETPEDVISRIFGAQAAAAHAATHTAAASVLGEGNHAAEASARDTEEASKGIATSLPAQAINLVSSLVRRIRGIQPVPEKAPDLAATAPVTITDLLKENWITVPLPEGREARFRLEPGAGDGQVIRLAGQGLKLQGMQRGDAVITLKVDQSGHFRVDGADIHTILPVNLQNAVLGCTAVADSPAGPVEVTVPAWSGSDQVIRIADGGLPKAEGGRGDLVVEIRLMLWEKPDEKVTDLMRSMREGLFL
ncbi:DnaJ domain-containing protein [Rhizobium sp. LjRoot30]|uniref:DnaJ C-terminal domain-containing protein n=1 Tax=Rhizobium sp. LjRoot30 TaxID=3342320 RepID=UPI003ECC6404